MTNTRPYPTPHPDATVQDVIDWAASGLAYFSEKQNSDDPAQREIANHSIPLLITVIAICEKEDPIKAVEACIVKEN